MNEPEPEAPKDLTPPAWLDELGLEFWNSLAPQLHMMGLLSEIDLPLFTAACERWSVYRRATDELQKQLTRNSKANGRVAKPEAQIAKAALAEVRAILAEFGIGPASRSRVVAKPLWGKDPVEEYKKRKFNARKFLA
jgi:P27 family predicted phage terminase small subunit